MKGVFILSRYIIMRPLSQKYRALARTSCSEFNHPRVVDVNPRAQLERAPERVYDLGCYKVHLEMFSVAARASLRANGGARGVRDGPVWICTKITYRRW